MNKRILIEQKELALTSCIQSLLSKNAIERVETVKSLRFYSHLFLVPKPHQGWMPVIDLSRLNTFLLVERFKMERPVHQGLSDSRGMGVVDRPIKRLPSHPHLLYPVSSVKEHNRKGGKCKISRVLQSPVSCTQASPRVDACNRPKQAQHLPTCKKVQNGNTSPSGPL